MPNQQVEVSATSRKPEDEDPNHLDELELLAEAHERFQQIAVYEQAWRKLAMDEMSFVDGLNHWTDEQKAERLGLPCLVFDKIGPAVAQVVNDARQNPPEAKISPAGNGADKETAEVIQGLLRNIDQDSSSSIAKMTGYEHAVKVGRGWWRVGFEFEHDDPRIEDGAAAFEQKIVIKRVANPFSVYPDPATDEFDYSDMKYCFVTEDMDRTAFEEEYPDAYCGSGEFSGLSDKQKDEWFPKGAVRIAEYWRVLINRERLALLNTGVVCKLEDMPEGAVALSLRWAERRTVKCAKITGAQVLEDSAWPGKWIPLVPCLGRELIVEGKRRLSGMVRPAMDANLSYDYMRSRQVQAVGLGTINPWMVAEGQLEGREREWNDANRKPVPFLTYKIADANGRPLSPPVRSDRYEPAIQAITVATQFADNDCKAMTSTYDASLGNRGVEESGVAVNAHKVAADNAHFNYHDNLARSVRHTARIELDLLPHVYSEARLVTIFDPDGAIRQEWINKPTQTKQGIERIYAIDGIARFDVVVGDGPSYATRRQQGSAALMELVRAIPVPMTRALDLVVKAIDAPDMDKLAERLRPPDIQQDQDSDNGQQDPKAQQQQMQQMLQQTMALNKQLTEHLNSVSEDLKTQRLKAESAERMNTQNAIAGILRAEIAAKSAEGQKLAQLDHDGIRHMLDTRLELLHMDQTVEQDAGGQQANATNATPPAPASAPASPASTPALPPPSPATPPAAPGTA